MRITTLVLRHAMVTLTTRLTVDRQLLKPITGFYEGGTFLIKSDFQSFS